MNKMMIANRTNTLIVALAALVTFGLTGCNENEDSPDMDVQEELTLAQNTALTESLSEEDISFSYMVADEVAAGGRTGGDHLPCADVTHDKETNTIVIDFGESCIGPWGRERSGKIIVSYGGAFNDQLANRVITFQNYFVNNRKITGTIELKNLNRNQEGFITATRRLIDYTIHFPNGVTYTANGSITREWIEGEGDGDPRTNVIRITGSYEGISSRGRSHTIDIVEPVIASFPCRAQGGFLRIAGLREIRWTGQQQARIRTVYYGDGSCDNKIEVTVNGRSFTITEE